VPNYRRVHEESLRENQPRLYRELKRSGELKAHLDEIVRSAREMHALIVKQIAERHPYNPAEWKKGRRAWEAWLERTANELVLHDRVLVPDAETEMTMRDGYLD
jgi:hypothetical protein